MERSASLSLIHEVLWDVGGVANVERRRNGLGNIFQGLAEEDISKLHTFSSRVCGRSLSCPCGREVVDNTMEKGSKPTVSKRKFHLLHNKRWARRRLALGDIFTGIPKDKIKELLRCKQRQRRLALADIFAGIPQEKVSELIERIDCSKEGVETSGVDKDCPNNKTRPCRLRRFALGDIFVDISLEEVHKLISETNIPESIREMDTINSKVSATENDDHSFKVVDWNIENGDNRMEQRVEEDLQNQMYMRTFFSSLMKQHHKQRCGYMIRTMSMPCYSQFDMEPKLPSVGRRNGQWDVLSELSFQEHDSLKGQYVSSLIFAS